MGKKNKRKDKESKINELIKVGYSILFFLFSIYFLKFIFTTSLSWIFSSIVYVVIIVLLYINKKQQLHIYLKLFLGLIAGLSSLIITIGTGHPITLGFTILAFTVAYNTYVEEIAPKWKLKRFEYYEMLILILTLIILDVTYPLLKPRIDIISVDNPTNGQLINDKSYAYREYALKVIPPLWPSDISCKNTFIGVGTKFIQKSDYSSNLIIQFNPSNGVATICTQGSFDINRLFSLGVLEYYPLQYSGFASRLDRFYWIGENDTSVRIHTLSFSNHGEFPILINSNLTFTIDSLTEFDRGFNMIKALTNESKKVNCKLDKFAMTPNLINLTPYWTVESYNKNKDFINISFSIFYTVSPNTHQNFYIVYYPYIC